MQKDIEKAIETMQKGGIILYPTDTIWGIGCDATNENAVDKIYKLKKRLETKSMLILLGNYDDLHKYVKSVPEIACQLINVSDKPLTIVYDKAINIAPNLINSDSSVGIRITKEIFSSELCAKFKKPIVSTSANISGEPTPKVFTEISKEIIEGVDYVVNYRQSDLSVLKPSSIIKVSADGQIKILRE